MPEQQAPRNKGLRETAPAEKPGFDPVALSKTMAGIAEQSQRLVQKFLTHGATDLEPPFDPMGIGEAFFEMTTRLLANPAKLMSAQIQLWQDYMSLWQAATRRAVGLPEKPVIAAAPGDRRFRDPAWQENDLFDFIKQSYLLSARWLHNTVKQVEGLDDKTAQKVDFYTRQFVDALAPSNFILTNPEVLRTTMETGGENLLRGLENLLEDLDRGRGIQMTDLDAFKIGENIAVTPGKVVFQNDLMQLIQYAPSTEKTFERPLLIIPPWINKFYILDLREQTSFVRWAVAQGHTVFMVSWVNPDEDEAAKTFEDYMTEGPLEALKVIEKITGQASANVIGYCLGGTLLACTLAFLEAKKKKSVASATFFTALVDFGEPGELGVFIDEEQLTAIEERMSERGYLDSNEMATTFNMLRANDLIWSFVVNNYLLGKDPFPFDLLYWNSDSTRMPAAMHSFYLRKMYQDNRLIKPGGIILNNISIDLRKITTPTYLLATKEDHIAPWKSVYAATSIYRGPKRFVLAASGHIAGVVNPPDAKKYQYWTGEKLSKNPDDWFADAKSHNGSWWPDWADWVKPFAGKKVTPPKIGGGVMKPIDDAPGTYVKVK